MMSAPPNLGAAPPTPQAGFPQVSGRLPGMPQVNFPQAPAMQMPQPVMRQPVIPQPVIPQPVIPQPAMPQAPAVPANNLLLMGIFILLAFLAGGLIVLLLVKH
jgi:hypothetical protein